MIFQAFLYGLCEGIVGCEGLCGSSFHLDMFGFVEAKVQETGQVFVVHSVQFIGVTNDDPGETLGDGFQDVHCHGFLADGDGIPALAVGAVDTNLISGSGLDAVGSVSGGGSIPRYCYFSGNRIK